MAASRCSARIPFGLKIFLTAVAIVDDLIAVVVIALFYSGDLNLGALGGTTLTGETSLVALGIVLGLVVGKPLGLLGASWLVVRTGIAQVPQGVTWQHLFGASVLGGIGFTMSLFIAALAFLNAAVLATAKLAILSPRSLPRPPGCCCSVAHRTRSMPSKLAAHS